MRIVFAGTPDYAVPSLRALAALAPAHEVVAVVTQPDRPKGRSKTPAPPPVKAAAQELGLPAERIFQKSINKPETLDALRALAPDLLCVVAYGGLLKKDALALAKRFPINAHGSLLPLYRGAAPIQAAILAGDAETGVCIMKMEEGLDCGPVMLRRAIPIAPADTAGTLHDKLMALSAECFVEAVKLIAGGHAVFEEQDHARATHVTKLTKDSGTVDWSKDAACLERFVRAMSPWPGAWATLESSDGAARKRIRIAAAAVSEERGTPKSVAGRGEALEVACGDGRVLRIVALQPEGSREMRAAEFLNGAGRAFGSGARML
ncbi:MAG: methionyl-tRNA formyltransferase [Planctomycetota bacterium]|nr:methionyl-tRNA formyltransferase [Planctomycetota bacterium]